MGHLLCVFAQPEDVAEACHPSQVDESGERLLRDAVDVHAFFRYEAGKLFQFLGRTGGVGTVQGACAAGLTGGHQGGMSAHGTLSGNLQLTDFLSDADDFRDDLIGFDDFEFRALVANAQSLALTDVAQRGTFHRGAFKLYGSKDGHGRDRRGRTTPFDMIQFGQCALVGPFKGIARACGMVAGDRSSLRIVVVVVGDDESVDGVGHRFHLLGPSVDGILDMLQRGLLNQFVLHRMEAEVFEPVHALSPRMDVVVAMHEGEGNPLQVALAHLVDIFQCERSGGEVARVGIFLVALHVELLKVFVADDTFATDDRVTLVVDLGQHAADG